MSLVWIVKIFNFRHETFTLQQNDPNYFPIIGNQEYRDGKPIHVGPGYEQDTSQFVIPWTGARNKSGSQTARLDVHGPHGVLSFNVGPKGATGNDFLLGWDQTQNELVGADMGPRGPQYSVSLHLVFNEKGMLWQVVDSLGFTWSDASQVATHLENIAGTLIGALVK